jgi:hypothetical protein
MNAWRRIYRLRRGTSVLLDHAGSATGAELGAKSVGIRSRFGANLHHVHSHAATAQIMFGLY